MSKKEEKELRETNLSFSYTIDALTNEVEYLEEVLRDKHSRLLAFIQENDRLTLRYEPYIPGSDEDHGKDFYGLIEENEQLRESLKQLKESLTQLQRSRCCEIDEKKPVKKSRKPKAGVVSIDFWPPSDWFRLSLDKWSPGQYAQLCIGPIRIDWFAA